jgi:ribosome-binding protein aMBF1 (putative translation factor)
MDDNERGPAWVAKKVGRTREMISRVYHGHLPVSDILATDLYQMLDIPLLEEEQAKHVGTKKRTMPT